MEAHFQPVRADDSWGAWGLVHQGNKMKCKIVFACQKLVKS